MYAILEVIQHLWGRPWFHEILIFLFFACVFLWYKISKTEKHLRWRVTRDPQDFQAHLNLAEHLSEFEDSYEEAELEFKKALEIEPKNKDALGELYLVQNKAGKTESAEKTILDLIQLFPNDSAVCVWAGIHYTDKDDTRAEEYFVKAKSIAHDTYILENYGNFLRKQDRFEEAVDIFLESLVVNPNSAYSMRWITFCLARLEKYKDAEIYARKAISLNTNNSIDFYNLGFVLTCQAKNAEARVAFLQALKLDPKNISIKTDLGKILAKLGHLAEAEKLYLEAINLEPTSHSFYREYGDFLQNSSRYKEARECYQKAIDLNEKDFGSHYNLGVLFLDKFHNLKQAEIYLHKTIEINPEFSLAYVALGNLHIKQEQFIHAEDFFRKALEIDPKDDYAQHCYSKLLIKLNRVEEAINILLEIKNNNPEEYSCYIEIAAAYKAIGKQKEMLVNLETSRLLIKQNSKNELYDLACVESIAGNTDLAFDYLRKSKEENQLNANWAWEDSDLDWIRDDSRFVEIVGEKPQEKLPN